MPLKDGTLTPQEKRFTKAYAATGEVTFAAAKAGYRSPERRGYEALKRPAINAEIAALCQAELHNELRPLANLRLRKILENEDLAPRDHIAAAKVVITECSRTAEAGAKDVHSMSPAELHAAIARIERQMDRAEAETLEPIEPATSPAAGGGSVFD